MVYYPHQRRTMRATILKRVWHLVGRIFQKTWFATAQRTATTQKVLQKCMLMLPIERTHVPNTSTTLAEGMNSTT
jgi:hypothetical protein